MGDSLSDTCSENGNILLLLLSFFLTTGAIPFNLLVRRAAARKRWTVHGKILQ
jgi:uncharacterized protein YdaU (DUF1376 family)